MFMARSRPPSTCMTHVALCASELRIGELGFLQIGVNACLLHASYSRGTRLASGQGLKQSVHQFF